MGTWIRSFCTESLEINRARKSADTEVPFRLNDLISGKDSVDFYRGTRCRSF